MPDVYFEFQLNVRSLVAPAYAPFDNEFAAFGATVEAFGELVQRVVWRTHMTVDPYADIRAPEVHLEGVTYGSPLSLAGTVKHLTATASERSVRILNQLLSRLLYHEEERERRRLGNESMLRDIQRKDIDNARQMLDLLRDAQDFSLDDIAALTRAVDTIQRVSGLTSHRVGPVTGGAAVPTDETTRK